MSINSAQPDYLKFIKNEYKTLEFLSNDPFIASNFNDLMVSAKNCHQKYFQKKDHLLKANGFQFTTNFAIEIEKGNRRIVVESIVNSEYSLATYVLSICKEESTPCALMRKFHFDFAMPVENDLSKKPVHHLQYGGKATPGLSALDIDAEPLYDWLSSPRLSSSPTNLALLLDTIFVEFRTEDSQKLITRTEWRNFIKENEQFLLAPYYKCMSSFVTGKHKSSFLIRDYLYGKK